MAEPVNSLCKRMMLASWWMLTSMALAQTSTDPTRPPDSIGAARGEAAATPAAGPVLQSVLISPGRKMAIISGQTVRLNGKFGDARLVHIGEAEVILRSGKTEQILKLFPDMKIRPVIQSAR